MKQCAALCVTEWLCMNLHCHPSFPVHHIPDCRTTLDSCTNYTTYLQLCTSCKGRHEQRLLRRKLPLLEPQWHLVPRVVDSLRPLAVHLKCTTPPTTLASSKPFSQSHQWSPTPPSRLTLIILTPPPLLPSRAMAKDTAFNTNCCETTHHTPHTFATVRRGAEMEMEIDNNQ